MSRFIKVFVVTLSLFAAPACMEMTDADDEVAAEVTLPADDEETAAWDELFDSAPQADGRAGAPGSGRTDIAPYAINQACGNGCVSRWINNEGTCRWLNTGWYEECMARANERFQRCIEGCGGGGSGGPPN
jgi:hypothetical protein